MWTHTHILMRSIATRCIAFFFGHFSKSLQFLRKQVLKFCPCDNFQIHNQNGRPSAPVLGWPKMKPHKITIPSKWALQKKLVDAFFDVFFFQLWWFLRFWFSSGKFFFLSHGREWSLFFPGICRNHEPSRVIQGDRKLPQFCVFLGWYTQVNSGWNIVFLIFQRLISEIEAVGQPCEDIA